MDTELEDYKEPEDNISKIAINSNAYLLAKQPFAELWEIEMEVLQVENALDRSVHGTNCPGISHIEYLEEYVDTDEEPDDKSDKNNTLETGNEKFPAMWELELEVLNCDQYSYEESSKELGDVDILETEMLQVYSSHDMSSTSINSDSIKDDTTHSEGEIYQAAFMVVDLTSS